MRELPNFRQRQASKVQTNREIKGENKENPQIKKNEEQSFIVYSDFYYRETLIYNFEIKTRLVNA